MTTIVFYLRFALLFSRSTKTYILVFKLQSMFCGQMFVKTIGNTQVTINPMFALILLYIGQAFRKR